MNVAKEVLDMQIAYKKLLKIHEETVEFLRTIGPNDPRSVGFIANRALVHLHEPTNYLHDEVKGICGKCRDAGFLWVEPFKSEQTKVSCNKCNKKPE